MINQSLTFGVKRVSEDNDPERDYEIYYNVDINPCWKSTEIITHERKPLLAINENWQDAWKDGNR